MDFLFYSAVILVLLIFFIWKTFVIVPNKHIFIKERLGKFSKALDAGFHFLVPFVDNISYKQILKEQVIDVPPQVCITKDNVQVRVDGILYLSVGDAERASYGIDNYRFAASQLAQTSMRSEIGKLDLDETFVEREKINSSVVKSIDDASEPWGVKVKRYEIKDIVPTETTLDSMEQQMKAEREKRADITHSQGERSATINRSEGKKRESINISEGEKLKRINEAEGAAAQIDLIASATAEAIAVVAQAIQEPGGQEAVQLRIAQEYIDNFGRVISKANSSVVPMGVAAIQGAFEGFAKVAENFKGPDAGPENIQIMQKGKKNRE
ncbi:MAG: paraslipin [Spirochaetia bacterium]|nr:paraslipin [Spirochaetia bacterium]